MDGHAYRYRSSDGDLDNLIPGTGRRCDDGERRVADRPDVLQELGAFRLCSLAIASDLHLTARVKLAEHVVAAIVLASAEGADRCVLREEFAQPLRHLISLTNLLGEIFPGAFECLIAVERPALPPVGRVLSPQGAVGVDGSAIDLTDLDSEYRVGRGGDEIAEQRLTTSCSPALKKRFRGGDGLTYRCCCVHFFILLMG